MMPRTTRALIVSLLVSAALLAAGRQPDVWAEEQTFTDTELESIARRLEKITQNHDELLKLLDALTAELAVAKVRATN